MRTGARMGSGVRALGAVLVVAGLLAAGCGTDTQGGGARPTETTETTKTTTSSAAAETSPKDDHGGHEPSSEPQHNADALKFTATTVDGQEFSGETLVGKPVVLWFWAAFCPICKRESPGVVRVAKANAGKVTFVGVAALTNVPDMKKFISDNGTGSFTNIADTESEVWKRFGVTQQPAYAFISEDGMVDTHKGSLTEEELVSRVDKLIHHH